MVNPDLGHDPLPEDSSWPEGEEKDEHEDDSQDKNESNELPRILTGDR